jgi:hypothetical protein
MAEVTAAKFEPEAQDERRRERYEGELECRLDLNGASWRCWIRDLSLGGAGLEPAIPAALGQRVTLSSPLFDFDRPLCGRVMMSRNAGPASSSISILRSASSSNASLSRTPERMRHAAATGIQQPAPLQLRQN